MKNRNTSGLWNQGWLAIVLSVALSSASWANVTNTASASYKDVANNSYTATSLQVVIVTPPVVTGGALTLDVGVAMAPYQITGTNSPTGYDAVILPPGLVVDKVTGIITGTPTAAGVTNVTLSATDTAGTGTALLTITVRGAANIALTKSANVANAKSGDQVTFTIAYTNNGGGTASNVTITDAIPAGSTFVTGSITGGGSLAAGTITWNVGSVAAGATGSVSFKVTIN